MVCPPPPHGHPTFYSHMLILQAPLWPVVWCAHALLCSPPRPGAVVWWVGPCGGVVGFGLLNTPSPLLWCGVACCGGRLVWWGVWVVYPPSSPCGVVVGFGLLNPPSPPLWCGVLWWWVWGFRFSVLPG